MMHNLRKSVEMCIYKSKYIYIYIYIFTFSFFRLNIWDKTIYLWVYSTDSHNRNETIQWDNRDYHIRSFRHKKPDDICSMSVHSDPRAYRELH